VIGENLDKIKKKWNLTQVTLAELLSDKKIKINKDGISNLIREKIKPPVDIMIKLEKLTGIPVINLIEDEIDSDDIPKKPLAPDQTGDKEHKYQPKNWRKLKLDEFFSRNEDMFDEVNQLKARLTAVEKKLGS